MNGFTVGQLARQVQVNVETLRYYERRRLIPKPPRSGSNYRLYSLDDLRRVKFIKQAQGLGFSLKEVQKLLALRAAPRAQCADIKEYASEKIAEIDIKIRSLTHMRQALSKLQKECSGTGPITRCPILATLEEQHLPENKKPRSKPSRRE